MPGNRHQSALVRMLVLPMAAARAVKIPAVGFDEFYGFADFHAHRLAEAETSCATIACLGSCRIISPKQELSIPFFNIIGTATRNSNQPKSLDCAFQRSLIFFPKLAMLDGATLQKFGECLSSKATKWRPILIIYNYSFAPPFGNKTLGLVNILKPIGNIRAGLKNQNERVFMRVGGA